MIQPIRENNRVNIGTIASLWLPLNIQDKFSLKG